MKPVKAGLAGAALAAVLLLVPVNRLFAAESHTQEVTALAAAASFEASAPDGQPAAPAAEVREQPAASDSAPHPVLSDEPAAYPADPSVPKLNETAVPSKTPQTAELEEPAAPDADPAAPAADPAEPADPAELAAPAAKPAEPLVPEQAVPSATAPDGAGKTETQISDQPAPAKPAAADSVARPALTKPAAPAVRPTDKPAVKTSAAQSAASSSKTAAQPPAPKPMPKPVSKPASTAPNLAAPAADFSVSNFRLKKLSGERIQLIWTAAPGATHYRVMRRDRTGSAFKWQASVTGLYFTDQNPLAGVNTYYVYPICKINGQVTAGKTSPAKAMTVAPKPVTGLKTSVSGRNVALSWQASRGANLYRIFRRTALTNDKLVLIRNTTALQYLDQNPVGGWQYYTVRPIYQSGKMTIGGANAPVRAAVVAPGPVRNLKAQGTAAGSTQLTWQKSAGATHYFIYRRHQQAQRMIYLGYATGTSWRDGQVSPGINYYAVVPVTRNGKNYARLSLAQQPKAAAAVRPKPIQTLKAAHDGRWNIRLSWGGRKGITRYQIFFKENGVHDHTYLASTSKNIYLNKLLLPGRHRYSIRAVARVAGKDYISADGNYVYATIAAPRNDAGNPEVFANLEDFMHHQTLVLDQHAPMIHTAYEFKSTPALAASTLTRMLRTMSDRIFSSTAFFSIKSAPEVEKLKQYHYVYRPVSQSGGVVIYRAMVSTEVSYHSTHAAFRQAEATAASVAKAAVSQSGLYKRVKYVFDWMGRNIDYVYKSNVYLLADGTINPDFRDWKDYNSKGHPVYSAAAAANDHEAVCQGYASFMINTLKRMGIKTHYTVSRADRHAWVMARLNGRWYHVDPTWGDEYGRNVNDPHNWNNPADPNSGIRRRMDYNYLLVSDAKINARGGHTLYRHFPKASCNYPNP